MHCSTQKLPIFDLANIGEKILRKIQINWNFCFSLELLLWVWTRVAQISAIFDEPLGNTEP